MDGMFNLGMYGLVSPQERNDDLKKKRGFFWANRDENQKKRKDTCLWINNSITNTCLRSKNGKNRKRSYLVK